MPGQKPLQRSLLGQLSCLPASRQCRLSLSAGLLPCAAFIEIMAPLFRMDLFEGFIRPTLHNAHVGWGTQCVLPNWGCQPDKAQAAQ